MPLYMDIHIIEGAHANLIFRPQVASLAKQLQAEMSKIDSL